MERQNQTKILHNWQDAHSRHWTQFSGFIFGVPRSLFRTERADTAPAIDLIKLVGKDQSATHI
jgi:hypothetical protein